MPANDLVALRQNLLTRIKTGDVLSNNDVRKLVAEIKQDGVTPEEVKETVATLVTAIQQGWDPTQGVQQKRIDALLGQLHAARPDALDALELSRFKSGPTMNWTAFVLARAGGTIPTPPPVPPVVTPPVVTPPVTPPTGTTNTALVQAVTGPLPIAADSNVKFEAAVGVMQALVTLLDRSPQLGAADVDALIAAFPKLHAPAAQAVCAKLLADAPKTDTQRAAVTALPAVADADVLLGAVTQAKADGDNGLALAACLTFAKNAGAVDSIKKGLQEYAKINMTSSWDDGGLDAAEQKAALAFLGPYVNNATSTALVFGAFLADAPKEVAKHTNARVAAQLTPVLDGSAPQLAGVPLSKDQAALIKQLVPGVKDEAAIKDLGAALLAAHAAFTPSITTWGSPPAPTAPLAPTVFAAFARTALTAMEGRSGTTDGMVDMAALRRDVSAEAKAIGETVLPHLRSLALTPPQMAAVALAPALADKLKGLLLDRSRSTLSAPNIEGALQIVAAKNGGRIEGAVAERFAKVLDDYLAEFPNIQLLDFNKLGRIVAFQIEGKDVPLCTLNGQTVKLAEFFAKVAGAVSASIDKSQLKHPWMSDRWGMRAKASVELLDVIAQKTAEGAGPVHVLRQQFPGSKVEVVATGKPGDHERFLYKVEGKGVFAETSDGRIGSYDVNRWQLDPVLFTAAIRDDGAFDVKVPPQNLVRRYPLQTPFSVGDSVDVQFLDPQAVDRAEEGKPFDSRYKVLHATITSYDVNGNYEVSFKDPRGVEQKKTLRIDDLLKQNGPHMFAERQSLFSDVNINIDSDASLKSFLEGADPIIKKHLPSDGSLLSLSTADVLRRQKACIDELMQYTHDRVKYPADQGPSADEASRRYHELTGGPFARVPLGELVKIQKGVCRHQCILEHLLLQRAGIDSRLASGAANTSGGDFRGFHIWVEVALADNGRYLSDQTWSDRAIPLWDAYGADKRRVEMYDRTSRYDSTIVF